MSSCSREAPCTNGPATHDNVERHIAPNPHSGAYTVGSHLHALTDYVGNDVKAYNDTEDFFYADFDTDAIECIEMQIVALYLMIVFMYLSIC